MLVAYYSKGCDSEAMFKGWAIGQAEDFREHLNQYDVIRVDVQWCRTNAKAADGTVPYMEEHIIRELREFYPDAVPVGATSLPGALAAIHKTTSRKFVIIIDEWDSLIRDEAENMKVQDEYIDLLRGLFKGPQPTEFIPK